PPDATLFPYTTLFRSIGQRTNHEKRRIDTNSFLRASLIQRSMFLHAPHSAWSQSFHTGSSPRRRRTAAISAGDRSSLISNWPVASEEHTSELQSQSNL